MASSSSTVVFVDGRELVPESDFVYENAEERQDFNNLKEVFGDDRSDEIHRQLVNYRHSKSKENRFTKIANNLITATEEEEKKIVSILQPNSSLVIPKVGTDEIGDGDAVARVEFQPSVGLHSKRLRSPDDESQSPSARLVRGDTEPYDFIAVSDQSIKLKKAKMFNNNSVRSEEIFKFLSNISETYPDSGFDLNVLYNRLEAVEEDFELECKAIMHEITLRQSDAAASPPPLIRKATSDETRAAIINILINEEGLDIKNNVEEVVKHVKEIEEIFPGMAPRWEVLFRRLATADVLLAEKRRIINEIDGPGSSKNVAGASTNGRIRRPSEEFLVEILSDTEQNAMKQILDMFPDVDPHFVLKGLAEKRIDPEVLVDQLSRGGYPRYKDRLEKQRKEDRRRQFLDPKSFDLDEFLRTFGHEPEIYFSDTSKPVTELYRYHALIQLQNDFPKMTESFLREQLESQKNHYFPALRQIQEYLLAPKGKGRRKILKNNGFIARKEDVPFPDSIDELFFRELQFVRNYDDIRDYLEAKKQIHKRRLEEVREKNELRDCLCCFTDDVLPEEMLPCSDETHAFCSACLRRHAEEVIAQGRHIVPCMNDGCENNIAFPTLRNLLQPRLMDLLLRRNQMAEIRQAGIENVASCPFCDFLLVMENDDDHIFSCRNPQCLRESCRLCKEPNHVPLKCTEVEKADETAMRTFIENRMADALIRNCPKCGQRIIKEDGCNKMKCPCGVNMCYVCRKDIGNDGEAYAHFGKRCLLHTSTSKVHDDPVANAGEEAKREFLEAHPELKGRKDIELKKLMDDTSKNKIGDAFHPTYFRRQFPAYAGRFAPAPFLSSDDSSDHDNIEDLLLRYRDIEPQIQFDNADLECIKEDVNKMQKLRARLVADRLKNIEEEFATQMKNIDKDFTFHPQPPSTFETQNESFQFQAGTVPLCEEETLDFREPDLIDFNEGVLMENSSAAILSVKPKDRDGSSSTNFRDNDVNKELLEQIEQRRIQVNEAQIRLCDKQRTSIRAQAADTSLIDQSVQKLMNERDQLLTQLRNFEETALRRGVPEDQVRPREENILTNDDIENSVQEARKLIEMQKVPPIRSRNAAEWKRKATAPIVKQKHNRHKIAESIDYLRRMLFSLRGTFCEKYVLIGHCQMARQIALEWNLNFEIALTEILREAEIPNAVITAGMQVRCAEVVGEILEFLQRTTGRPSFNQERLFAPLAKPVAQGADAFSIRRPEHPQFKPEPEFNENKALLETANAVYKAHEAETKRLNQQLKEVQNELVVVREQKRILEGREADLNVSRRRILEDIEARKPTEKRLKKRLIEVEKLSAIITVKFEKSDRPLVLETVLDAQAGIINQQPNPEAKGVADCLKKYFGNTDVVPQRKFSRSQFMKRQAEAEALLKRMQLRFDNYLQKTVVSANKENRLRERLIGFTTSLRKIRQNVEFDCGFYLVPQNPFENNTLDVEKQLDQICGEMNLFDSHICKTSKNSAPLMDFDEEVYDVEDSAISILYEKVQFPSVEPINDSSDVEIICPALTAGQQPVANKFDMIMDSPTVIRWDLPGPSGWKSDQSNEVGPSVKPKSYEFRASVSNNAYGCNQAHHGLVQINAHLNSPADTVNDSFINLFTDNKQPQTTTPAAPNGETHPKDDVYWDASD